MDAGYLEKVGGRGRGNISIYYVTKKGGNMTPFNEEKRGQIDTEKGANMTEKGGEMPPINKGINKEINKENSLSSFDGSKSVEREEEDKEIFLNENNIAQAASGTAPSPPPPLCPSACAARTRRAARR